MKQISLAAPAAVQLRAMDKKHRLVKEALDSISCLLKAHKGFAELVEVKGNKAVIYCGGRCARCKDKCIEDAVKTKLPDIEITFR